MQANTEFTNDLPATFLAFTVPDEEDDELVTIPTFSVQDEEDLQIV